MTFADLTSVWTPLSAGGALVSGVMFGLAFGLFAINPTRSRSDLAGPLRIALIATLFAASAGLVFYAGQALAGYLVADPLWFRVMSRYGPWLVFSASIGVTTWVLIRHDRSDRHSRARKRALDRLGKPRA